ncbi:MAG: TPM domain-containing protein, partial [Anaerotignum sp.]
MKKKWIGIFTLLCMLLSFVPAFAEEGRVFDNADLLTAEEEADLQALSEQIQQDWELDLAYLTTNDTEGMSVREYGAQVYMEKNLGIGEDYSGLIFVVDMGSREAQIVTSGRAIDIFTDYYIEIIWDEVMGYLSDGDFYGGMVVLGEDVSYYCGEYQKYLEDPDYISSYEQEQDVNVLPFFMGIAVLISLVIAGIGVSIMRGSCKTILPYTDGRAYLKGNGCHMTVNQDTFASTRTNMMPIPKDND